VGVARALYCSHPVLLLDDPFAALDQSTATHLLQFLRVVVQRDQRVILLATHSLFLFSQDSNPVVNENVLLLQRGQVKASGSLTGLMATKSSYFLTLVARSDFPNG
jgi:ABC-type thiamine transport system ATPase subunit